MTIFPLNKTPPTSLKGNIHHARKKDKSFLRDQETLKEIRSPELDTKYIEVQGREIKNSTLSKAEGETLVADHHGAKFDAQFENLTRTAQAENGTLKHQERMASDEERDTSAQMEKNPKSEKVTVKTFALHLNKMEKVKLATYIVGMILAMVYAIFNVSNFLKANSLQFFQSNVVTLLAVSIVFVFPTIVIKSRFDELKEEEKGRWLRWLFRGFLASFALFLVVFCLYYLPQPPTTNLFDDAPVNFTDSPVMNFLSIFSQILLEILTATLLAVFASKTYQENSVQTDQNEIHQRTKHYQVLSEKLQEVQRDKILIQRRLSMLDTYFKEIQLKRQLYITEAITAFQTHLRKDQS